MLHTRITSTPQKYFAIGDIHGNIKELAHLLERWDRDEEQLVFIGDYIDRGPDSAKVVALVRRLVEEEGAIALRGNHEEMLEDFLAYPAQNAYLYLGNGGYPTMQSYGYQSIDPTTLAHQFRKEQAADREFLANLPVYFETPSFLFVHAGINPDLPNWRDSRKEDLLWIREAFYKVPNRTGKTVVFGHTPTVFLHPNGDSFDIWENREGNLFGIDGGISHKGGCLHGIHLNDEETDYLIRIDTIDK